MFRKTTSLRIAFFVLVMVVFALNCTISTEKTYAACHPHPTKSKIEVKYNEAGDAVEKITVHFAYYDDAHSEPVGTTFNNTYNIIFTSNSSSPGHDTGAFHPSEGWNYFDKSAIFSNSGKTVTAKITQHDRVQGWPKSSYGLIEGDFVINDSSVLSNLNVNTTYYALLMCTDNRTYMWYTGAYATVNLSKYRHSVTFDYNGHGDNFVLPTKNGSNVTETAVKTNPDYEDSTFDATIKGKIDNWSTVVTNPTASGYDFKGWYTDSSCTSAATFNEKITGPTTYYAKWEHTHSFSTTSNGTNEIGFYCTSPASGEECSYQGVGKSVWVKLNAEDVQYSGNAYSCTVSDDASSVLGCATSSFEDVVFYCLNNGSLGNKTGASEGASAEGKAPKNAGHYRAKLDIYKGTIYANTIYKDFEIEKADSSVETVPTAKSLVYSGEFQQLINAGEASGGALQYSLDNNSYSEDIPTGKEAGAYTVYYKVVGDRNHNDTTPSSIQATIGKKERDEIIASVSAYTYNQKESLPIPELTPIPTDSPTVTYYYNTSESNTGGIRWSELTAKTLKKGTYYVYAVIDATDVYKEYSTEPSSFSVNPCPINNANEVIINAKVEKDESISEIVKVDGDILTETNDYTKEYEKNDKDGLIDYIIIYTFTGDYSGTVTKKISKSKPQKEDGDKDGDVISTVVDKQKAADYAPIVKAIPESNVKSVIEKNLKDKKDDPDVILQLEGTSYSSADKIVEELEDSNRNMIIESNLLLEIEKREESTVSTDDAKKIKEKVNTINPNSKIGYLDISMYITYTLSEENNKIIEMSREQVTDTQDLGDGKGFESTITIDVPRSMQESKPSNVERTYYVVRIHNGECDELAHTTGTRIVFKTSKFSTYGIFYKDREIPSELPSEEPSGSGSSSNTYGTTAIDQPKLVMASGFYSPKTGDSYEVYVWVGLLFVGIIMAILGKKNIV